MNIVCDTQINENMHDRVIYSQLICIIKWMPRNGPDK